MLEKDYLEYMFYIKRTVLLVAHNRYNFNK